MNQEQLKIELSLRLSTRCEPDRLDLNMLRLSATLWKDFLTHSLRSYQSVLSVLLGDGNSRRSGQYLDVLDYAASTTKESV